MARRVQREWNDDLVFGCIVLGILIGAGAGMIVTDLTHSDHAGIGTALLLAGLSIPTLLRALY